MAENKTLDVFNSPADTGLKSGDGLQMDFSREGKFCLRSVSDNCTWADIFPNNAAPSGNQPSGSQWPGTGSYATCTLPAGKTRVVITFSPAESDQGCPSSAEENREAGSGLREEATEITGHTITVGS